MGPACPPKPVCLQDSRSRWLASTSIRSILQAPDLCPRVASCLSSTVVIPPRRPSSLAFCVFYTSSCPWLLPAFRRLSLARLLYWPWRIAVLNRLLPFYLLFTLKTRLFFKTMVIFKKKKKICFCHLPFLDLLNGFSSLAGERSRALRGLPSPEPASPCRRAHCVPSPVGHFTPLFLPLLDPDSCFVS